jgi:hypothetical protein
MKKKKQLLKLLQDEQRVTAKLCEILLRAYASESDHSAEDESGPDPRHPALSLPERPEIIKSKRPGAETEPHYMRFYQ